MSFWDISRWCGKSLIITEGKQKKWYADELQAYIEEFKSAIPETKTKSLILVLCQNNLPSLIAYLSALQSGHAVMLVNAKLHKGYINSLISYYTPEVICSPYEQDVPASYTLAYKLFNYKVVATLNSKGSQEEIHPDLALLLSTSGSTGSPKFVRLSYESLKENAKSIAEYLAISSREKPITSLPFYYSYGLSVLNSHLLKGASVLLTDEPVTSKNFWQFANEHGATSIAGVPYTYQMLAKIGLDKCCPSTLSSLTQAGGRLDIKLAEHFSFLAKKHEWKFFIMYGQTEATARISYLPTHEVDGKLDSIGVAIPGGEMVIDQETSELIYKGPNVMMGYAEKRADLQKGDQNKGVLYTGDIAEIDEDGFAYIRGRMKRFLKLFGVRINLDMMEKELRKHFNSMIFCSGTDDRLCIFHLDEIDSALMKNYIKTQFGIHFSIISIKRIVDIPLNSNKKVDYEKLKIMSEL